MLKPMTKTAIDQDLTVGDRGWGKLQPAQCGVHALQRLIAHPLLDPCLTVDICIHGMLVGNEEPGQSVTVCSPDFVENHPWSQHSLGLFYFGGFFFFPHMQGSKTSVFIKDILFFRLEKITKKKRTNKSLQRKKRPTMYSPWVAILNWFRVLSTAGSLRAGSLPPTQAVHHSLHTQPIHGLILHQLCFIYRSICRVLSSLWNPSAGCSILYYFDALIFLLS